MKIHLMPGLCFGIVATTVAASAQQPPPLRLNVPYTCPGNMIVVVKHCEKRGETEVCSRVKGAPNAPMGDEVSMPKAQAAALGLTCTQGRTAGSTANGQPPSAGSTQDTPP